MTDTKPARILIVSNFFPPGTVGGAEIVASRQARALVQRGHEVTILAGREPSAAAPPGHLSFDHHEGLPVYRMSLQSLDPGSNFLWPAAARRLVALISSRQIDAVHMHNLTGLGANLIAACRQAKIPCGVTLHDHWGFCFRATRLTVDNSVCVDHDNCAACRAAFHTPDGTELPIRLRRDYVAWCLQQADFLISPSRYLAGSYQDARLNLAPITVLSNGIDLNVVPVRPDHRRRDDTVRFLCSAYLGEHKGIMVLLDALNELAADRALSGRWCLTIAGDGHLRPVIEQAAGRALAGHLKFIGRVPRCELLDHLKATDVVVLPSIWPENEPVSMLEAIAAGCAQIATDIGGNPELVNDGLSGYLVEPGNARALCQAMRQYILDPSIAEAHGAYNRARRDDFDEIRSVRTLETMLSTLLERGCADRQRDPIVICGSASAPAPVQALIRSLHTELWPGATPRLVWSGWIDASVWQDARLIWLWDRHPNEALVTEALSRGIPVLAPASDWIAGLSRHYGGVVTYRTYLEAMAALRTLFNVQELSAELAAPARAGAASAAALAHRAAFDLRADVLA